MIQRIFPHRNDAKNMERTCPRRKGREKQPCAGKWNFMLEFRRNRDQLETDDFEFEVGNNGKDLSYIISYIIIGFCM